MFVVHVPRDMNLALPLTNCLPDLILFIPFYNLLKKISHYDQSEHQNYKLMRANKVLLRGPISLCMSSLRFDLRIRETNCRQNKEKSNGKLVWSLGFMTLYNHCLHFVFYSYIIRTLPAKLLFFLFSLVSEKVKILFINPFRYVGHFSIYLSCFQ